MIALQVQDVKDFMSRLLIGTDFDAFWLCEANVTTFVTYHIDGSLHKEFFDSEQAEMLARTERTFSTWKEIKPFCFSIMKGKHTPLHFKIVFQLSRQNVENLLGRIVLPQTPADVVGLYLNLQYDGSHVTCTTGTSLRTFTMDKSLDRVWDEMVTKFFKQQQIPVLLV